MTAEEMVLCNRLKRFLQNGGSLIDLDCILDGSGYSVRTMPGCGGHVVGIYPDGVALGTMHMVVMMFLEHLGCEVFVSQNRDDIDEIA